MVFLYVLNAENKRASVILLKQGSINGVVMITGR